MYVEKRKVKGRVLYYLGHSFREGKKIHKIRKYLGADLSSGILKDRKEKAKELIFIKELEVKAKLKVFYLSENQWKAFSELFTYSTNAIEGSELDKKEVKEILEKNKWPEKSKEDIAEAYGVNEVIKFIRETKEH